MGNSLKKSVKAITTNRLSQAPYLLSSVVCPICKVRFERGDSNYAAMLHAVTCYLQATQKKFNPKPPKIPRRKSEVVVGLLKERFNKIRINWQEGSDEIYIARDNILENSLLQIEESKDLINLHKVTLYYNIGMEDCFYRRTINRCWRNAKRMDVDVNTTLRIKGVRVI